MNDGVWGGADGAGGAGAAAECGKGRSGARAGPQHGVQPRVCGALDGGHQPRCARRAAQRRAPARALCCALHAAAEEPRALLHSDGRVLERRQRPLCLVPLDKRHHCVHCHCHLCVALKNPHGFRRFSLFFPPLFPSISLRFFFF